MNGSLGLIRCTASRNWSLGDIQFLVLSFWFLVRAGMRGWDGPHGSQGMPAGRVLSDATRKRQRIESRTLLFARVGEPGDKKERCRAREFGQIRLRHALSQTDNGRIIQCQNPHCRKELRFFSIHNWENPSWRG